MARITALAKAMQAAGNRGQIDFVRAQVFLGLLLGTIPYIPPPEDAPEPPDDGPEPPDDGPGQPEDDGDLDARDPAAGPGQAQDAMPGDGGMAGPSWPWPGALPYLPPGPGSLAGLRPRGGSGGGGLLNLTVPMGTVIGVSSAPGQLSRLGVLTPDQARQLANLAAGHAATRWRIVVVTPGGEAIAVTHLPRSATAGPGDRGDSAIGLIGRVTLVIRTDEVMSAARPDMLGEEPRCLARPAQLPTAALARILERAQAAAGRAAAAAAQRRQQDERSGGCGHSLASAAYRPPARIAELVIARDCTCRFGPCRRPADQCDLDHVVPFEKGGLTCSCNLGGDCRSHHRLKQHPGWSVTQPVPGVFRWTTPAGRTYVTRPDTYLT
jgi:hypothetical protein